MGLKRKPKKRKKKLLTKTQKQIIRQMYRETKGDPEWMRKYWDEPE